MKLTLRSGTAQLGIAMSRVLQNITGIGSIVILAVLFIVTFLMLLDRDLQRTVDFIKGTIADWKEKYAEKREKRAQQKAEKAKQKEEQREIAARKKQNNK